jgi:hypothetical protein
VTDAVTHAPLANICVDVWDGQGDSASGCTDSTGAYTTGGLPSGTYNVDFYDDSGLGYLTQSYPGTVVVHLGLDTSGINAALTRGGVLAGTVTDAGTSLPLGNICVVPDGGGGATSCDGLQTDDNGEFSENIAPGTYTVDFVDPANHYIATSESATVVAGSTTTISAALSPGGTISGLVSDASNGAPLTAVCPVLYDHGSQDEVLTDEVCTGPDGRYTIGGLAPGTYDLDLTNPNGRFIPQWYVDAGGESAATPITVGALQSVIGINASMTLGGVIAGTVRSATTGLPLSDICVTIYTGRTGGVATTAGCTDATGSYVSPGLPPGDYSVEFIDPNSVLQTQWYNNQTSQASATLVHVTSGAAITGVDASMRGQSAVPGGTVVPAKLTGLLGNAAVQVSGSGWQVHGDTTVVLAECVGTAYSAQSCNVAGQASSRLGTGTKAGTFKKVSVTLAVGSVGTGGQTCGVSGSPVCYLVGVGNTGDSSASTALAFVKATATAKATKSVKANTVDAIKAAGFPAGDAVTAEECDSGAVPGSNLATNCDQATVITGVASSKGKVGFSAKGVVIKVGSAYTETGTGTCSSGGTCSVIVNDTTRSHVSVVIPITLGV